MSLGNRILELITERNISQKQLANDINIAPSTLNGYIQGNREPDIAMLYKISMYFNVTIDYLIGSDNQSSTYKYGLNEAEYELINIYRCLDEKQKKLYIEQGKLLIKLNSSN